MRNQEKPPSGLDSPMRSRLVRLAQLLCKLAYRLLPAGVCTRLAVSRLGNRLGSWLTPAGVSRYQCDFGIKLILSRDDAVLFGFAHMGRSNPFETELVRKHLRPGDTLIQIGAYKEGWLSLVGSRVVGNQGRVICFEPIPEYAESLRQNVRLNSGQNMVVEQLAISDVKGTTLCSVAGGNSSIILTGKQDGVTVDTISLDEYVRTHDIHAVDFLIIDAEGAEPLILKGAQRTLVSSVSFVLMEVCDEYLRQSGTTDQQLIQTVVDMSFHPYIITRRGLRRWNPGEVSETCNMFFSKADIMMRE